MYKTLVIEISIIIQVLANTLPENKTYAALVKEKGELFKEINEAIQESIAVLKKNNDTEAVLGIEYMNQLKEQLKEVNGTDITSRNDKNIDTRRRNKVTLNMAEIASFLHGKAGVENIDTSNLEKKSLAEENKERVQKQLDLWVFQQQLESENKAKKKKVTVILEDCPRWGHEKRKKKKKASRRQNVGPGGPTADKQILLSDSETTTKEAPILRCYKNAPKDATCGPPRGPRCRRSLNSGSPEPHKNNRHSDQSRLPQQRHKRFRRNPQHAPPYMPPAGFMPPQANMPYNYGPPPSPYVPQSANGYPPAYGAPSPHGAHSSYGAPPPYGFPQSYGVPSPYGVPPPYGAPSHYGAAPPLAHAAYGAPQHYGPAPPYGAPAYGPPFYGAHPPYATAPYMHHSASIFPELTEAPLISSTNMPPKAIARRANAVPEVKKATPNNNTPPPNPPADEPLHLPLLNFDELTFS